MWLAQDADLAAVIVQDEEPAQDAAQGSIFAIADEEPARERAELVAWLGELADADDNRRFNRSELAEISREINALYAEVRTLTELNRQQQKAVEQLLERVQGGSERMGRKDWVTFAIGTATTLVITGVVPPLALWPLAVHAFHALGHLFILDA
jgi:flagellar motility protein MotE (MotC chaperone)